jgi:GNAT superfamily N-acetyltransferase
VESILEVPSASVRPMADRDVAAVASLLDDLGYPTTEDRLRVRCEVDERSASGIFVAEVGGRVVGCLSLAFTPYFPDGSTLCRVTALVVAPSHRGRGFGAALIAKAVEEGRHRGCSALEVTTADRRADAHRFYEQVGFSRTSLRFVRQL